VAPINTIDDLASFRDLLGRVSADPAGFSKPAEMARSVGVTVSKLNDLLRAHAHLTPQSWLRRLRVRKAAATLLATRRKPVEVAADAGFANEQEFEAEFLHEMRMSAADFRTLGRSQSFQIQLPVGYRAGEVLAYHARDPEGLTERSEGNQIWKALASADGP
jgi:AraC family transcriptional regulator, regulatory protein of adaptative response / DNA-3-methyladenine glycosylase II